MGTTKTPWRAAQEDLAQTTANERARKYAGAVHPRVEEELLAQRLPEPLCKLLLDCIEPRAGAAPQGAESD